MFVSVRCFFCPFFWSPPNESHWYFQARIDKRGPSCMDPICSMVGVSNNRGVSPFVHRVFHYFHHPFWGSNPPIFGNTHVGKYSSPMEPLGMAEFQKTNAHSNGIPSYTPDLFAVSVCTLGDTQVLLATGRVAAVMVSAVIAMLLAFARSLMGEIKFFPATIPHDVVGSVVK